MFKKISIRSTPVLVILGVIAAGLMILVEFTKKEQSQPHFQEKLEAAHLMEQCMTFLKEKHFGDEIAIDNINDPNDTRIIGTRFSPITSGRGSLPVKLSTVNPNFAALIVELFRDAGLEKGDHIALGATGSFPSLNIATCAAAEVMDLEVTFISSVSSSSWGANQPEFAYPDMHSSLYQEGLLSFPIRAASIGANQDIGRTLSPEGRELIQTIISRNGLPEINTGSLEGNIGLRMAIFHDRAKELKRPIKLYVNIGGGVASLGSNDNRLTLPSGLVEEVKLGSFEQKKGVVFEMAREDVPFINLLNVQRLMDLYDLPRDPVPLPPVGEGKLFTALKYDLRYVLTTVGALILLIGGVILFDRRQNALGNEIIHQENA